MLAQRGLDPLRPDVLAALTIRSSRRPATQRNPSSSRRPRSPVWSHPSAATRRGHRRAADEDLAPLDPYLSPRSSGLPAEPGGVRASSGPRVQTCEQASVSPYV